MAVMIIDNPFDLPNGAAATESTATLQSQAFFAETVVTGPSVTAMTAGASAPLPNAVPAAPLVTAPTAVAGTTPVAETMGTLAPPALAVGTAQPLVATATASPAVPVFQPTLDIANEGSPHLATTADTGLFGFV